MRSSTSIRNGEQSMHYTQRLSSWVMQDVSRQMVDSANVQVEILLLDHLACALRGACLPWGRQLSGWAASYGGAGNSLILGTAIRTSAMIAGLVNATAAHGLELDDTHDASLSHPGAAVVATAIAIASERSVTGQQLFAAIAAGYEVTARVGMATGPSVLERGFHPTALFGGFGAAATAAVLYGLDEKKLVEAWGLLLSMVGGSMQFSEDPAGTVVKRLHGGYGALHGIMAVQLASHGLSGPTGALDGRYGLLKLFGCTDADPTKLVISASDKLAIQCISLKPYPCCRLFHSTIDALRDVLGDLPFDSTKIKRITVGAPRVVKLQHMMRRPQSTMAAQYSLPFCVAAVLAYGPIDDDVYRADRLGDPVVLACADLVECVVDDEMENEFPAHFGSWVEIEFVDGEKRRAKRLDSRGTPAYPMSHVDVMEKFSRLIKSCPFDVDVANVSKEVCALKTDDSSVSKLINELSKYEITNEI